MHMIGHMQKFYYRQREDTWPVFGSSQAVTLLKHRFLEMCAYLLLGRYAYDLLSSLKQASHCKGVKVDAM